jgi:hypothetical protein
MHGAWQRLQLFLMTMLSAIPAYAQHTSTSTYKPAILGMVRAVSALCCTAMQVCLVVRILTWLQLNNDHDQQSPATAIHQASPCLG